MVGHSHLSVFSSPEHDITPNNRDAMNKKNVALIGYGYWGQKIYNYLQSSEDFHIRYVFFRGLKDLSGDVIKRKYGSEFVSAIDVLLDDKSVPNVIIATPVDTHYEITKQALLKSKNVLVEKPLATDPTQSRELIKIAKERNLKLETDYTFTYSQALSSAQKIIEEGAIGRIESIALTKRQLGRFLDYDVYTLLGTHCMSMLDMFLPIHKCEFYPKPLMNNKGITTAAIIYFESVDKNCRGHIDISLHCPERENKVIIYGQNGTIVCDLSATNALSLVCYSRCQPKGSNQVERSMEKVCTSDESQNLRRALKHFSEVLENRVPDNSKRAADITEIIATFSNKTQHIGAL